MPRIALNEVADVLCAADVLLVTLRSDPLFEITIPSKTQFYLCIGKPILMAVRGEAALLIEQAKSGLCVPPSRPEALADAVLRLKRTEPAELAAMGRRGRAYYGEQLSFASAIKKTLAVLRDATGRSAA
jgi:glycosyltransferase involved in cell wall biosynthesis